MTCSWKPLVSRLTCLWAVALITACSQGDGSDSSFGSFGGPGGNNSAGGSADDASEADSGDTASDTSGADGEGESGTPGSTSLGAGGSSDDTGMTSTSADGEGSSGDGSSTGSVQDGSSSGDGMMGNPGDQPASGMWAHCTEDDNTNCAAGANDVCVFLDATEGLCSAQGCVTPALDCDPAPAGTTAPAICADAVVTGVCALDCSVGDCPDGMTCTTVSINMGPDTDICV